MSELLKISLTFVLIMYLLRKKVPIGYVMLTASAVLFLLHMMPARSILGTLRKAVSNSVTIKLVFALSLIRIFEIILRENHVLAKMMTSVKVHVRNRKMIIISMPVLIGMLPSLGGAYFSAPMVKEATTGLSMSQEEKAFINYWFRHPWEYVLPLYPGILLASAICSIPLNQFMAANMVYASVLFITGFFFSMRGLGKHAAPASSPEQGKKGREAQEGALLSFLPVMTVLVLVMVFRVELHFALVLSILPLVLIYKYRIKDIVRFLRHGFAAEVLVLIFGIMLFKETLEASGTVQNLSRFFLEQGIPVLPVLCLLPFLTGLLTGLTVGFVGGTFPLLISISGGAGLSQMSLAFAAGFIGVLLSPVHLCLVLTREYFKADLWGVYRRLIPAAALILIAAFLQYFALQYF